MSTKRQGKLPQLRPTRWTARPARREQRSRSSKLLVWCLVAVLLAGLLGAFYNVTAVLAVPLGLAYVYLALTQPFWAFVVFLCAFSLLPIQSHLFGHYVPNWTQLGVPVLIAGALLQALRTRGRQAFVPQWADLFVIGFILVGYAGVFREPGVSDYKYFTNQQLFPAVMYFIARWLPIDRSMFRQQLRYQLLGVVALSVIMVATPVTGFDPFYHGLHWLGLGVGARGPMWSAADTVAYTAIWPALLLYAAVTGLPTFPLLRRRLWSVGTVLAVLATVATAERTGPIAIGVAFLVCSMNRRMLKPILIGAGTLAVLVPIWFLTPAGDRVHTRFDTLTKKGAGFERAIYRRKALDYIHSRYWNPILGTGFGRLTDDCVKTMPATEWCYDYNWMEWRPFRSYSQRPTHCAPLTVWGEFGYAGVFCLGGFILAVGLGLKRAHGYARRLGRSFDTPLALAAIGALLGVVANGLYHNTESVAEVLFMMWAFSGVVIGHPEVFALSATETSELARRRGAVHGRAVREAWAAEEKSTTPGERPGLPVEKGNGAGTKGWVRHGASRRLLDHHGRGQRPPHGEPGP